MSNKLDAADECDATAVDSSNADRKQNKNPAFLQGFCTAYGIRTRITTVKGWCPSP